MLANEATALCHGRAAAEAAAETARRTFVEGASGAALPTVELPRDALEAGIPLTDLLCRAGLAASKGEARRLIRGGGGKLNDETVSDELRMIKVADLGANGTIKLSAGKKRHALVRVL